MARRGRKPIDPAARKTAQLSVLVTPALRAALEVRAGDAGRSLGREIEMRLQHSLSVDQQIKNLGFDSPRTFRVFQAIASQIANLERFKNGRRWWEDRWVFDNMLIMIKSFLAEAYRPKGRAIPPKTWPDGMTVIGTVTGSIGELFGDHLIHLMTMNAGGALSDVTEWGKPAGAIATDSVMLGPPLKPDGPRRRAARQRLKSAVFPRQRGAK
jgi:hypothetical protein